MRVGFGFDAHRLVADRPLILGGVRIAFDKGLEGFSDADVLTHAVIDAVLGAAALGDCGSRFPAGDPKYANANSIKLLEQAFTLLRHA
ncbi:MAG TPA: 2-C-methyl-D-erythritol 2,4-cyclodiphosphate synthase, partial [Magnetospirillaceae bacterium]|nr:2-C-methyl-D-erythritol 2,4-cyclodiphosphate synthase [Magnetospirillaceae bacterium]